MYRIHYTVSSFDNSDGLSITGSSIFYSSDEAICRKQAKAQAIKALFKTMEVIYQNSVDEIMFTVHSCTRLDLFWQFIQIRKLWKRR
jgi:hypothetical protein